MTASESHPVLMPEAGASEQPLLDLLDEVAPFDPEVVPLEPDADAAPLAPVEVVVPLPSAPVSLAPAVSPPAPEAEPSIAVLDPTARTRSRQSRIPQMKATAVVAPILQDQAARQRARRLGHPRAMTTAIEDIPLKTIDGEDSSLAAYAGQVRLVVNVASRCGLTPQYAALEALHEKYADRGFAVLGFPANEFGAQEPGSNAEIQEFCATNFGVRFPMFSKIVVKGAGQHPLYASLTSARPEARTLDGSDFRQKLIGYGIPVGERKEILLELRKFLVDRQGNVIERFSPDVPPDASIVVSAIEESLSAP